MFHDTTRVEPTQQVHAKRQSGEVNEWAEEDVDSTSKNQTRNQGSITPQIADRQMKTAPELISHRHTISQHTCRHYTHPNQIARSHICTLRFTHTPCAPYATRWVDTHSNTHINQFVVLIYRRTECITTDRVIPTAADYCWLYSNSIITLDLSHNELEQLHRPSLLAFVFLDFLDFVDVCRFFQFCGCLFFLFVIIPIFVWLLIWVAYEQREHLILSHSHSTPHATIIAERQRTPWINNEQQ